MVVDLLIFCVMKVKTGNEDGKPLVMQTGERLTSSVPRRKESLEWVILNPAL